MEKKRHRIEIIHDILATVKNKPGVVRKTHILYKSNLSTNLLNEYLGELISGKMMRELEDKKGKKYYELCDRGYEYLMDFKTIRSFMESYGLD